MSVVQELPTPLTQVPQYDDKHTNDVGDAQDVPSDDSEKATTGRKAGSVITIIGSALANFSDGYQQNLASSTNVIFNHLIGTQVYTSAIQTRISNSLLVGSVIGIVLFGYLADKFSRKGGSRLAPVLESSEPG